MKPLPCPFCGTDPQLGFNGPVPSKPFYVRCSRVTCPAHNAHGWADGEVALTQWNRRAQLPPADPKPIAQIAAFTTKDMIRGEMVWMTLDRIGLLTSDKLQFSPDSPQVFLKPRDW
jgi:hypothetical protein